jgi:hypothetical protein
LLSPSPWPLCKSENTKTLGVRFSALLTEGGAERLELVRV